MTWLGPMASRGEVGEDEREGVAAFAVPPLLSVRKTGDEKIFRERTCTTL